MQKVERNRAKERQNRSDEEAPAPTLTTVPVVESLVRCKRPHKGPSPRALQAGTSADQKLSDQVPQAADTQPKKLGAETNILRDLCGTRTDAIAGRLVKQVANALLWPDPSTVNERLDASFCALKEMAPKNGTEAMLATQMIACHEASLLFLNRAAHGQYEESVDRNVHRASRLMRVFTEQLEALQRLRGKSGQQKVTVEHVHVHEGGQAIVGSVNARRVIRRRGGGNGEN